MLKQRHMNHSINKQDLIIMTLDFAYQIFNGNGQFHDFLHLFFKLGYNRVINCGYDKNVF